MKHLAVSRASMACLVAMFLITLGASSSQACLVIPTGLGPDEPFRLAFVTSGMRNAESTDIADYNAFVSAAANAVPELAALNTEWYAIASTATTDARDNTGTAPPGDVPVYLLNGTMLAESYDDLWDWSIVAPLDYTELCATVVGSNVIWTGTGGFGTADQALGVGNPTIGSRTATINQEWVRFGAADMSALHRFYAISGVLTMSETPIENGTWDDIKAQYR